MRWNEIISVPEALSGLVKAIRGRSYETAKRVITAKIGSVGSREKIDDDVADAVFARLQRNAQVGAYTSEDDLQRLGRGAQRLSGEDMITLYRAAPKGAGIRPGDFTAGSSNEAGFYKHGGNQIQSISVPLSDVISVQGSVGGGQEYVYLPKDYVPSSPKIYFASFIDFYRAVNGGG